jgi:predicted nucleic acid-binding protein
VKQVFVDTSAFFGLLVSQDEHHARARELFAQATAEKWKLAITNIITVETYALLLNHTHQGRPLAIRFLDWLERVPIHVERVTEEDERRAVSLVRDHDDKAYSLCDALSFTVMERLGIREAIAFDRDFRTYGRFTIL